MAEEGAPYVSQDPRAVSNLIRGLESGSKNRGAAKRSGGFSCKGTTFQLNKDVAIKSWKFMDWDYKRDDLPTYARGLFTHQGKNGQAEIVIRGYDKFFNISEVHDTLWEVIEKNTKGPYELSVKENGCIIFISGLEDGTLLVCSKHSTGARGDANASHAVQGEQWIDRHLASVGKTKKDLALELRRRNATAVAELCDDSFEEHVLAYDETTAGLYLHGINLNLPEFSTYSGAMVHKFADEWGFKKAEYLMKNDIKEVKTFLDGCAETGSWNGRDTEGFVVRCKKKVGNAYEDWFFKYKFEEPYLMYRQWREATKAVIAGRQPRFKKHQKITEEYLLYARRKLAQTPGLGKQYQLNHGIIAMRDGFLAERGLKGSDIARQEYTEGNDHEDKDVERNIILIPVATIGCGKTTVSNALVKLFGWGHIQNDNITTQKGRPKQFALEICNALENHPVVIADRNNHQKRERRQLFEDISPVIQGARFVALHYVHHPKDRLLPNIRRATQARVLERGDNHQTIHAGTKSQTEIVGIMEGFLQRFEPVDPTVDPDYNFHEIIDLDVLEDSRHNLETIVNALHSAFPKLFDEMPTATDLDDAIKSTLIEYSVDLKHDLSSTFKGRNKAPKKEREDQGTHKKNTKIEYFAIKLQPNDINSALHNTFQAQTPAVSQFYNQLQKSRRIQPAFHVTLIHRSAISQHADLWSTLTAKHMTAQAQQGGYDPVIGQCRVHLDRIVWDNKVMCIVAQLLDESWQTTNKFAHITIGTRDATVKPVESNALLERWAEEGPGEESGIRELEFKNANDVWGQVRAVTPGTRG